MCRKADPESKGRIEKVVQFVKANFARHRTFYNIDQWNQDCQNWLQRRGNGKVHGTTRKIPAEVFLEEKKYLKPVLDKIETNKPALSLTYQVRKDNTVPIKGNRYTVPKGTYKGPHTYVRANYTDNNGLVILELDTNIQLGQFEIPVDKGNLVKNTDHIRDKGGKIPLLIDQVATKFSHPDNARDYLECIRVDKPRYIRDQVILIQKAIKESPQKAIDDALDFCMKNKLYRATDFRDAVIHYKKDRQVTNDNFTVKVSSMSDETLEKIKITPKIRDMSEYINALGGIGNVNHN